MDRTELLDVNYFAERILNDRYFRNQAYFEFIANNYGIDNVFGHVDPKILNRLIKRAKWNHKIRDMLTDILLYVDASSMTDENFRMLLRFPYKCRRTYLSNICHGELSFYQMKILNQTPLAMEAFIWLFDKICCYDCFTHEDLLCILRENPDVRPIVIRDCISSAIKEYGQSQKIQVAQAWLNNRQDSSARKK